MVSVSDRLSLSETIEGAGEDASEDAGEGASEDAAEGASEDAAEGDSEDTGVEGSESKFGLKNLLSEGSFIVTVLVVLFNFS